MSPSPEEWERLGREAPEQWRMLVNSEIRHMQANAEMASRARVQRLENHEVRLVKLETRVALYAVLGGAVTGGLISALLTLLPH